MSQSRSATSHYFGSLGPNINFSTAVERLSKQSLDLIVMTIAARVAGLPATVWP
jgi:hypothetical protein